jgi:hypothetical protein
MLLEMLMLYPPKTPPIPPGVQPTTPTIRAPKIRKMITLFTYIISKILLYHPLVKESSMGCGIQDTL